MFIKHSIVIALLNTIACWTLYVDDFLLLLLLFMRHWVHWDKRINSKIQWGSMHYLYVMANRYFRVFARYIYINIFKIIKLFFINRKGHILHFQRMSSLMRSSRVWTKSKKIGCWEFGYGCSHNRLILRFTFPCVTWFNILCCFL